MQAPPWVPDEDAPTCTGCKVEFGVFTRRHHCRACGNVFCAVCCDFFRCFPDYGIEEGSPCCFPCYLRDAGLVEGQKSIIVDPTLSASLPVLVLGGALSGMTSLLPWCTRLAQEMCRKLILVELPGLGARFHDAKGMGPEQSIEAMFEVMQEHQLERAHVLGYSMGGFLAMKFAFAHPQRVAGLIIGGASWTSGRLPMSMIGLGYKIMSRRMTWSSMKMFFDVGKPTASFSDQEWRHFQCTPLFFSRWPQCVDIMCEPRNLPEGQSEKTYFLDNLRRLRELGMPIMLLNGSEDSAQKQQAEFQDATQAKLHVCIGAKHEVVCTESRIPEVAAAVTFVGDTPTYEFPDRFEAVTGGWVRDAFVNNRQANMAGFVFTDYRIQSQRVDEIWNVTSINGTLMWYAGIRSDTHLFTPGKSRMFFINEVASVPTCTPTPNGLVGQTAFSSPKSFVNQTKLDGQAVYVFQAPMTLLYVSIATGSPVRITFDAGSLMQGQTDYYGFKERASPFPQGTFSPPSYC